VLERGLQPARFAADTWKVAAHPLPALRLRPSRVHWRRLPLAILATVLVSGGDLAWKAAVLAAHHGSFAMDVPSSPAKPFFSLLVGILALGGALLLPWLCVPGVLLVVGGVTANVTSLALWRAVPNPVGVHVAGGTLHFNLADVCVLGGGLLFLSTVFWTLWRLPAERFA
jgi:hypothetical protein